jgi:proline racemase
MADWVRTVRRDHDWIRTALITEPRGSDVMVGALVTPPVTPEAVAGVIFFNNVGYLGMCGHGLIGVVTTLGWLGRISPGDHLLDTPVGTVATQLHTDGRVTFRNVPSYRFRRHVAVELSPGRIVHGDIAWGGNWFFLCHDHGQRIVSADVDSLVRLATEIRNRLETLGICGDGGSVIDHIELIEDAPGRGDRLRNFVLCPGMAYDRSPCGTGASATVACMAEEGSLDEGTPITIEGISGESFEVTFVREPAAGGDRSSAVLPIVTGRAFVNGRAQILFDPLDPFRFGMIPGAEIVS